MSYRMDVLDWFCKAHPEVPIPDRLPDDVGQMVEKLNECIVLHRKQKESPRVDASRYLGHREK